jgi:beta-lactamase superfamily II metal-dependent hydrolase
VLRLDRSSRWNTASFVVAVGYAGRRMLFPGDADSETWEEIFTAVGDADCDSDVVVAAHHGARVGERNGESYDRVVWKRALRPGGTVVISHGCDNQYAHPHNDTIEEIRRCNGEILCTQRKTMLDMPDPGLTFDFETVGMALNVGSPGKVSYRREGGAPCCGDIEITLSDEGVTAAGARSEWRDRQNLPGCCQFYG